MNQLVPTSLYLLIISSLSTIAAGVRLRRHCTRQLGPGDFPISANFRKVYFQVGTRPQADELGQHSQQHSRTVHEYLGDLASIEDRSWRNGRFPVLIFEGSDPSMSEPAILRK